MTPFGDGCCALCADYAVDLDVVLMMMRMGLLARRCLALVLS